MNQFACRIAVVTGGGTGIGRELVRQLGAQGCNVAMCDLFPEMMAETKRLCEAAPLPRGLRITTYIADVSDEAQVQRFRDEVAKRQGADQIHLLFSNAGIAGCAGSYSANRLPLRAAYLSMLQVWTNLPEALIPEGRLLRRFRRPPHGTPTKTATGPGGDFMALGGCDLPKAQRDALRRFAKASGGFRAPHRTTRPPAGTGWAVLRSLRFCASRQRPWDSLSGALSFVAAAPAPSWWTRRRNVQIRPHQSSASALRVLLAFPTQCAKPLRFCSPLLLHQPKN